MFVCKIQMLSYISSKTRSIEECQGSTKQQKNINWLKHFILGNNKKQWKIICIYIFLMTYFICYSPFRVFVFRSADAQYLNWFKWCHKVILILNYTFLITIIINDRTTCCENDQPFEYSICSCIMNTNVMLWNRNIKNHIHLPRSTFILF